jgi:glycosyltransferase involved in cell wall biosynthesis
MVGPPALNGRRLNILYHHRTQARGVEGVHIGGVVNAWRAAGHDVDVVGPPGVRFEQPALDAPAGGGRRGVLGLLARHLPNACFELMEMAYNVWAMAQLGRAHRRRCYDLVYERYAFLNLAGLMTTRPRGIPFVLEVNFTTETEFVRRRTRIATRIQRAVERYLFRRADAFVVVSSALKALLVAAGVDERRIAVFPNAGNPEAFAPGRDSIALRKALALDGRPVVGFVGHFFRWHGVDLLMETFAPVKSRFPNVAYLLVGDGPTRPDIERTVRERGWERDVLLPGRVPHRLVPEYVALFDVAVMPHSNDYGSPMKIAEYMASGKAVLAPRLWPIQDMVEDGRSAVLFTPGDAGDAAKKLVALLENSARRQAIGAAGRQHVEASLNWAHTASGILTFADGACALRDDGQHPFSADSTTGSRRDARRVV